METEGQRREGFEDKGFEGEGFDQGHPARLLA